jgi:hypothetical protein
MQVATSDLLTVGNLFSVLGTILLALLSYIGVEIRRDVREMKYKVTILWDRSERDANGREAWDGSTERRHNK